MFQRDSLVGQLVKHPPLMSETLVWFLSWEDPSGGGIGYSLQYSWASLLTQLVRNPPATWETWFDPWVGKIPWSRERLPTPVFWPGEFHGLCSPWGRKELDTTEQLSLSFSLSIMFQLLSLMMNLPCKDGVTCPSFQTGKLDSKCVHGPVEGCTALRSGAGLSVLLWMPATSFLFPWPSAAFLASRSFVADVSALCVFTLNMAKGLTPDVSSWCETPDVFSLNWGRGRETPERSNYPRALCAQRHRDAS